MQEIIVRAGESALHSFYSLVQDVLYSYTLCFPPFSLQKSSTFLHGRVISS